MLMIPITLDGHMYPKYPDFEEVQKLSLTSREGVKFDDTLYIDGIVVFDSELLVRLIGSDELYYFMLLSDFMLAIKYDKVRKNHIAGTFDYKMTDGYVTVYLDRVTKVEDDRVRLLKETLFKTDNVEEMEILTKAIELVEEMI